MIKEDRVILMTRLAVYEQKEQKRALAVSKYYRTDYISVKMIETAIATTLGYLILLFLGVFMKADYLSKHIVSMNLLELGKWLIAAYIIMLAAFLMLAYIIYSIRYRKIQKSLKNYGEDLKQLYLMYKKDLNVKKREEGRAGGQQHDETIGI